MRFTECRQATVFTFSPLNTASGNSQTDGHLGRENQSKTGGTPPHTLRPVIKRVANEKQRALQIELHHTAGGFHIPYIVDTSS